MSDHDQAPDKIDLHNRQQLSALMDGALAPDEARFLLRRLQHDRELSECWERWQLAGEVMRGRATAALPHGFAERVGRAVAGEAAAASKSPAPAHRTRWIGGVALAASMAVVALFAARQPPNAPEPPAPVVAAAPAPTPQEPAVRPTSSPDRVATQPSRTAAAVETIAIADAPRRSTERVRPARRAGAPRTSTPRPATGTVPTEVAVATAAESTRTSRPFDPGTLPSPRPWPRAVLPQFGSRDALTAGADASRSPSFYPFEPRLPEEAVETQAGPTQPR